METELSHGRSIERALGGYIGSDGGIMMTCMITCSEFVYVCVCGVNVFCPPQLKSYADIAS